MHLSQKFSYKYGWNPGSFLAAIAQGSGELAWRQCGVEGSTLSGVRRFGFLPALLRDRDDFEYSPLAFLSFSFIGKNGDILLFSGPGHYKDEYNHEGTPGFPSMWKYVRVCVRVRVRAHVQTHTRP